MKPFATSHGSVLNSFPLIYNYLQTSRTELMIEENTGEEKFTVTND
jgi:hypothetical protein